MFGKDFYPTPPEIIDLMIQDLPLAGNTILEPSAGKGNIVDRLTAGGAAVIACEKDPELRKILETKCKVIADDFLTVTSDQISHVSAIVMNPPFSADERHILHAWEIAPQGCNIVALCNSGTLDNTYTAARKQLKTVTELHGHTRDLGDCFSEAERTTGASITMIRLKKPGTSYETEFEGFFMDEEKEAQENGIMQYNVIRDLVNRYVGAVKIYDEQIAAGIRMSSLVSSFYGESIGFQMTAGKAPTARAQFKKDMQKAGWKWIFEKLDMQKYATRGLKEDINKFVEQQTEIPFTMKNIYRMLDIVIGTTKSRMDRALQEVFDWVTSHADENKYGLPGWKTNSHYLLTRKFIVPDICPQDKFDAKWNPQELKFGYGRRAERMDDLVKALCYITADDYSQFTDLDRVRDQKYGQPFTWAYFTCKGFKKGTMHFEFVSEDVWAKFNKEIARIKGYPLFEGKQQTAYQDRQTGRAQQPKASPSTGIKQATILFSGKVA